MQCQLSALPCLFNSYIHICCIPISVCPLLFCHLFLGDSFFFVCHKLNYFLKPHFGSTGHTCKYVHLFQHITYERSWSWTDNCSLAPTRWTSSCCGISLLPYSTCTELTMVTSTPVSTNMGRCSKKCQWAIPNAYFLDSYACPVQDALQG